MLYVIRAARSLDLIKNRVFLSLDVQIATFFSFALKQFKKSPVGYTKLLYVTAQAFILLLLFLLR